MDWHYPKHWGCHTAIFLPSHTASHACQGKVKGTFLCPRWKNKWNSDTKLLDCMPDVPEKKPAFFLYIVGTCLIYHWDSWQSCCRCQGAWLYWPRNERFGQYEMGLKEGNPVLVTQLFISSEILNFILEGGCSCYNLSLRNDSSSRKFS